MYLLGRQTPCRSKDAGRATLRTLEIFNEPDYNWTPEEVKIEGAGEPFVNRSVST